MVDRQGQAGISVHAICIAMHVSTCGQRHVGHWRTGLPNARSGCLTKRGTSLLGTGRFVVSVAGGCMWVELHAVGTGAPEARRLLTVDEALPLALEHCPLCSVRNPRRELATWYK